MTGNTKQLTRSADLDSLMKEMNTLADGIEDASSASVMLFQMFETFPLPSWIKLLDGNTIHANRAYRRDFVCQDTNPKKGQREEHTINDIRAAEHGGPLLVTEDDFNPRTGQNETYVTVKWPLEVQIKDEKGTHWTEAMGGSYLMLIGGGERHGFPV